METPIELDRVSTTSLIIHSSCGQKNYEITLSENGRIWFCTQDGEGLGCEEGEMYDWLDVIFQENM